MTDLINLESTLSVIGDVLLERDRQDAKWGQQDHPNGTGGSEALMLAGKLRDWCDRQHAAGKGTWAQILVEEIGEAFAEESPLLLRAELIQVAAVAVGWIESIERADGRK